MRTAQRGNKAIAGKMARRVALMMAPCLPATPLHATVVDGAQLLLSPGVTQTQPPQEGANAASDALPNSCESYVPANASRPAATVATLISYRITVDGEIKDATLYRSSGYPNLDNAVLACVKDRRSTPVTINGKPAEVTKVSGYDWTPNFGSSYFSHVR